MDQLIRSMLILLSCATAHSRPMSGTPEVTTLEDREALNSIRELKAGVLRLAGQSIRCEEVSDCVAIPMGRRACGGPSGFVVTAKSNPSLDELQKKAERVTMAEEAYLKKTGEMSICSVLLPPTLSCENESCTAGYR